MPIPTLDLRQLMICALVAAATLGAWGCDSTPMADDSGTSDREISDRATSADAEPGACAGATAEEAAREYHPRILRGRVLAPGGALAAGWGFPQWLVGSAHAAPLEEEQTVPEASVELYRVGPAGERDGAVLRQTTTDVRGEWCMKLPDGVEFGVDLMLEARSDDTRLRRSVASELATDLYSTSEALVRLLEQRDVDFAQVPDETYLNMESIAATTVGLMDPVVLEEGDGVDEAVEKIARALEDDGRLQKKLTGLPTLK